MFISKMNRMFHKHGRVAFGLLTIVIIVPFVLYFSAAPSELFDMFDFRAKDSNVQIDGKTVSQEVLQNSVTDTLITMAVNNRNVDFASMRDNKDVLEQAAQRIMLLRAADARGLKVDDASVAGYIRQIPMFSPSGKFNLAMYKMFVEYYLGRYRITEEQFENTIRGNLLIQVLQNQTTASVIASDSEIKQFYNDSNRDFSVQVARFNSTNYTKSVKVDAKELQQYYEKNQSKYINPAKYKFHAVRFNFIKYRKEAEKSITDKEISAEYKLGKDTLYKGKTEKEVSAQIKSRLVDDASEKLAKNQAQTFAVAVYKLIESGSSASSAKSAGITFDAYAAKNKYTVHDVNEWVTAQTKVIPRMGKVSEVTAILGRLYKDQPISNAVKGSNAYFVVCLTDKQDARKASFEEVKDKVTSEYKAHKAAELAQNAADKAYDAVKAGKSVDSLGIKFSDVPQFSQKNYMPLVNVKDGIKIFQAAVDTAKGSVSKPVDGESDTVLVYVKDIKTPAAGDFDKNKDSATQEYLQYKKWILWFNYVNSLKDKANIVITEK